MQINPPVQVICSTDIPMYDTEIYLNLKYPIENIYEAIEKGYLSKSSIKNGEDVLDIYDSGDDEYNIFTHDKDGIDENYGLSKEESIEFIKTFLSTKPL